MIYYNMSLFLPCADNNRFCRYFVFQIGQIHYHLCIVQNFQFRKFYPYTGSRKEIIMEIERKFLVTTPPENYEFFPCHEIEQAYLCTEPVVRVRKEDDTCYLTYKSKGLLAREEYNLPLTKEAYAHLLTKADGNILTKKRYLIPVPGREDLTVEFDVFEGKFAGLMLAEIEFTSEEDAREFPPLSWFDRDVTWSGEYQNSRLSKMP